MVRRMNDFLTLVRNVLFFVRLSWPWARGAVFITLKLMTTSIISLWIGVPTAVSRIADDWLDRAFIAGFPTQWDRHLYYLIWAVALITVIIGWILTAYITVWLVNKLIF